MASPKVASITISLSGTEINKELRYGLMSRFILDTKAHLEAKNPPVKVKFSFQTSNFELPKEVNTEVGLSH